MPRLFSRSLLCLLVSITLVVVSTELLASALAQESASPETRHTGGMLIAHELLPFTDGIPELSDLQGLLFADSEDARVQADQLLTEYLKSHSDADVLLIRAAVRAELGERTSAFDDLDAAIRAGVPQWRRHWLMNRIHLSEGNWEQAREESKLMGIARATEELNPFGSTGGIATTPVDRIASLLGRVALSPTLSVVLLAGIVFLVFWLLTVSWGRRQRRDAGGSWTRLILVAAVVALLWTIPVITYFGLEQYGVGTRPAGPWFYALLLSTVVAMWQTMSPPNISYVGNEPLPLCEEPALLERIRRLSEMLRVRVPRVRVQTATNSLRDGSAAFVGGLAPFSVVLYDTVLRQLREDEQDAVIGHELAHVANRSLLVYVATVPLATVCGVVVCFFGGGYLGAVSAIALRSGLLRILSRRFEYDCDRRSALATSPDAMARGLKRIHVGHVLGRPTLPSSLALSCSTHPTLDERVAALQRLTSDSEALSVPFDPQRVRLCRWLARGFVTGWLLLVPLAIAYLLLTGNRWPAWITLHIAMLTPSVLVTVAVRRAAKINRRRINGRWRWSKLTRRKKLGCSSVLTFVVCLAGIFGLAAIHNRVPDQRTTASIGVMLLSLSLVGSLLVLLGTLTIGRAGRRKVPQLMLDISPAFQRGDYERVVKIASANYKMIATDRFLRHNSALALLAIGRREKAVELLESLHHDFPWLPVTATTLSHVALDDGHFQRALDLIEQLQPELDRWDPLPFIDRCQALRGLGRTNEALAACQKAQELAPDETTIHALLAVLALDLGDREEADRQIALGEALLPAEPQLRLARAERAVVDGDVTTLKHELQALRDTLTQQPLLLINQRVSELEQRLAQLTAGESSHAEADPPC
jgi:Zn-dependent protease with chaperone function